MASSTKLLISAHVIVSGVTREVRSGLIGQLAGAIGPLTLAGSVDLVDAYEPEAAAVEARQPGRFDGDPSTVHPRLLSNALKHAAAMARISSSSSSDCSDSSRFALVLEDDAVFASDVRMHAALERAARQAPADAGIVFLGLPSSMPAPAQLGDPSKFEDPLALYQALPACDSYLVTPLAASRLSSGYLPMCPGGAAAQLTRLLRNGALGDLKAYLSSPNAFVDGSKAGAVTSSLTTNNALIWNQTYCRLAAEADGAAFDELWPTLNCKDHPDALVLLGDRHARAGRHAEAEAAYQRALDGYTRDVCIVDTSSEFMKRFMAVYRHLQ
jgi:hypothetical protein